MSRSGPSQLILEVRSGSWMFRRERSEEAICLGRCFRGMEVGEMRSDLRSVSFLRDFLHVVNDRG